MKKVQLFNKTGQQLTEINIKEQEASVDGIQWGGKIYIWSIENAQYREANIVPAILNPDK